MPEESTVSSMPRIRAALVVAAVTCAYLIALVGPAAATPGLRTSVTMYSEGEYIGGGQARLFTRALGSVTVNGDAGGIAVDVSGGTLGDSYTLTFAAAPGKDLRIGTFLDAQRTPFREAGHPGIDISGSGRGCNEVEGRFDVRDIAFDPDSGRVTRLWLLYEHHCEGGPNGLFGEVAFRLPAGPQPLYAASGAVWFPDEDVTVHSAVVPIYAVAFNKGAGATIDETVVRGRHRRDFDIRLDDCSGETLDPGGICQVLVRFTPSVAGPRFASLVIRYGDGNRLLVPVAGSGIGGVTSVDLQSDQGDWVGAGQTYAYDPSNAQIVLSGDWYSVHGSVESGDDWWSFDFEAPQGDILAPGSTFDATRYPFNGNGAGMDYTGNGRGCNEITGTFTVNDLEAGFDGAVEWMSLDFEQHCEGGDPALHGQIRYRVPGPDATAPAAPTGLSLARDADTVTASWTNPVDDLAFVVVAYSLSDRAPIMPTVQRLAYVGTGTSVTIGGVAPGSRVSVAVFPVDAAGNVGKRAVASSLP